MLYLQRDVTYNLIQIHMHDPIKLINWTKILLVTDPYIAHKKIWYTNF